MAMMQSLETIDRGLNRTVAAIVGLLLALAATAVFLQIVVRFVLPPLGFVVSAPWTEESARFLMTWAVFLGSAVLCRRAGLIAVTSLPSALPPAFGRLILIASSLCTAFFFGVLAVVGWKWALNSLGESATVLRIPMAVVYASMPVGSVLAIFNLALFINSLVRAGEGEVSRILAPSAAD